MKAFANEDYEIEQFTKQNKEKRTVGIRHAMLHAYFWPFSDLVVHLQIAISIAFGGYLSLKGAITVGEFSSFFTYGIMVTWPLRQLGRTVSQMGMAVVAMDRLSNILDAEKEVYDGKHLAKDMNGKIRFENVSFSYPGSDVKVLKNVSFEILPGESAAIIGPAGSGKTTIIQLLLRFYEPDEGTIYIDDIAITDLSKSSIRERIGAVLQNPFLFSTTIYNNIAYTDTTASEEKVIEAAKAAGFHEIAHIFNDGYHTMVGEKGVTLSGGQKQRVALARTLLEQPSVLILDDATSAVDTETEYKIQHALKTYTGGKTSIVIAHRVSSIQFADKVIVLDEGEIIQIGSMEKIKEEDGYLKEMLELQTSLEEDLV